MSKIKKAYLEFICISISCLFLSVSTLSFFASNSSFFNKFSLKKPHSFFLVSHLEYYKDQNKHDDSHDTTKNKHHLHEHKHSEHGEKHSHDHYNVVAHNDLAVAHLYKLETHTEEIKEKSNTYYFPLRAGSFVLQILRPPILA